MRVFTVVLGIISGKIGGFFGGAFVGWLVIRETTKGNDTLAMTFRVLWRG